MCEKQSKVQINKHIFLTPISKKHFIDREKTISCLDKTIFTYFFLIWCKPNEKESDFCVANIIVYTSE